MANPRPLWDEPEPVLPIPLPQLSPQAVRREKYRQRYPNSPPTDILEWLKDNRPQDFGELMDLRRALYGHRTHGQYRISKHGYTMEGELKFVVKGPAGPLLILSDKSRHFLLRTLCRLRKGMGWPPLTSR